MEEEATMQERRHDRPAPVVIVEPDAAMARLFEHALRSDGCEPVVWQASDDPCDHIRLAQPALVVIGVGVGAHKVAWTLLNQLRADRQTAWIPILFCVADPRVVREQGPLLRSEGYEIVEEPFELNAFLAAARRLLATGPRLNAGEPLPGA